VGFTDRLNAESAHETKGNQGIKNENAAGGRTENGKKGGTVIGLTRALRLERKSRLFRKAEKQNKSPAEQSIQSPEGPLENQKTKESDPQVPRSLHRQREPEQ